MVHVNGVVPAVLADAVQEPPQRRDALGADREADVLIMGGAGQRPGEVPGVGAQRHPPPGACPPWQRGQRPAQQIRRGRPRVISPGPQVSGQHDLRLRPAGHVRPPRPLPLVVIGHAALLRSVHLHIGGIQVDRHRPASQRRRPRRGQQAQHPPGDRRQARFEKICMGQVGGSQVCTCELGRAEIRTDEIDFEQSRSVEVRAVHIRIAEIRVAEINSAPIARGIPASEDS